MTRPQERHREDPGAEASITRRRFIAKSACAGASLIGAAAVPALALPGPFGAREEAHAAARGIPSGFSPFDATSPWAKPSFLTCEENWFGAEPDRVESHGSSFIRTSGGLDWSPDIFMQAGRPYWVIGMENSWNWFVAEWASVGYYHGRRVGCRMTVSEPASTDRYNDWGSASGWEGDRLQERYGARHFFVLAQTFFSELSHWICGLQKVKQRYEFFYADDPSRTAINIDWAYYCCRSVQRDGGGNEWASPGANWQGHAFVPKGMQSSAAYWTAGCYAGWNTVATSIDEKSDRTAFMFDYSGTAVEFYRGDTAGWDGYNWSFAPFDDFHRATLSKRSSNPSISGATGAYSLAGAVYGVYLDEACTVRVGSFKTDANGDADLEAVNGTSYLIANNTYYVKEISSPPDFLLDEEVHAVYLDADKVLTLTEAPKSVSVRFYVDGDAAPVHVDSGLPLGWNYSTSEVGYQRATKKAAKPNCTPGLGAWYTDKALTKKYAGSTLDGDLDLYARNIATLAYAVAPSSKLTADLEVSATMDDDAPALDLYRDVLPASREANWGSTVSLKEPKHSKLYHFDGERWRTLRRSEKGWHDNPTATGSPKTTQDIRQDTTVYTDWTMSTYDGIAMW